MTIRKGDAWGVPVARPADLVVAHGDAELARLVASDAGGTYAVAAGDLFRTLGSPGPPGDIAQRLPIDVLEVETDASRHLAVAHVVLRRSWWRGPVVAVCNADHVGEWNVAPRAHPNDGRFDVVSVDPAMRIRERWEARRRLPTGTHVPHPSISTSTATEWTWVGPPVRVWVDGVAVGRRTSVSIRLRVDAAAVHV